MAKSAPQKHRRNERERNRVNQVNQGFNRLRDRVPRLAAGPSKKMSKVETLREAVRYIQHLQTLLQGNQYPSMYEQCMQGAPPPSVGYYDAQSSYCNSYKSDISPSSGSYYSDNSFDDVKYVPTYGQQQ